MDEANYAVNPEANGKRNNPIWILIAVLILEASGWKTAERSRVNNVVKRKWNRAVGKVKIDGKGEEPCSGKDVGRMGKTWNVERGKGR